MTHSTHAYAPDPRNASILIDIDGALYPRADAKISVFDSGFILGDGVWEGLRVHKGPDEKGVIAFLDRHLRRLYEGAKTLDFDMGLTKDALSKRLYNCLDANNAHDGVHNCLCGITRGVVLELARANGIVAREKNFSLHDAYGAEEAFVTGTFAGLAPVSEIDGRKISDGRGPMVERLQALYRARVAAESAKGR